MRIRVARWMVASTLCLASAARADWSPNGVPVCTAAGDQQSIAIASDGAGGAFVAWTDFRTGTGKIYLQHLASTGSVVSPWPADGMRVSNTLPVTSEDLPRIVSDDSGGVMVAWAALNATTGWDILALRLTGSGAIAPGWDAYGFPVCTLDNQELPSGMAPDGSGGAYIVWRQAISTTNYARAQHLLASGQLAPGWPWNGLQALWGSTGGLPRSPTVAPDGRGGARMGYQPAASVVFSSKLDFTEVLQNLGGNGIVSNTTGLRSITVPVADSTGGTFFLFPDYRNGSTSDVYGQHITVNGYGDPTLAWGNEGLPVCTAPGNQSSVVVAVDRRGGVLATWQDMRSGHGQIYGQHLSGLGVAAAGWDTGGSRLGATDGGEASPTLVDDVLGGGYVAWEDTRGADSDIYAVHFDSTGHAVSGWPPGGSPVCSVAGDQSAVKAVLDGSGGAIVAWTDHRGASYDIYAQHLSPHGIGTVDVRSSGPRVPALAMGAPTPNPASTAWSVGFTLSRDGEAALVVTDIRGAIVTRRLVSGAAFQHVSFDAHLMPPGLYFVSVTQGGRSITRRLCVIR
jgi:hypothetical protein